MHTNLRREFAAAGTLALFGLLYGTYAVVYLPIGTFAAMRAGMFPMIVGLLVFVLGTAQGVVTYLAYRRSSEPRTKEVEPIQWHSLAVVVASMAAFSAGIKFFGLIPAIVFLTVIASFGSDKLTIRAALLIAAGLVALAWGIFVWALALPFTLLKWPL